MFRKFSLRRFLADDKVKSGKHFCPAQKGGGLTIEEGKSQMLKRLFAGAIAAGMLFSNTAFAATSYPTFVLDTASSSINITETCVFGCVSLEADFAAGADAFSWTPTGPNDMTYEGDFIDWTVGARGASFFDVEVTLAFSAPDAASGSTTGGGGAASFTSSLFGIVSGGYLTWDGPATINFAQGSSIDAIFDGTIALGLGTTTTTGAKFVGNDIVADIAPVPLPAAGWLLIAGVGGLGAMSRRRKKKA